MKSILITLALALSLSITSNVLSQDLHFSQTNQIPLLINPGATGVFDGWERITINHKNQWTSSNVNYYTSALSFDMNLMKPKKSSKGAYMGLGLQIFNDIAGDSKLGTRALNLSSSVILPIDRYQIISLGVQAGLGQKSINSNSLYFGNQFTGQEFSTDLPSNEQSSASELYTDISTGIYYRYNSSNHRWRNDNRLIVEAGLAYFHINKPKIGFSNGNEDKLYSKFGLNFNFSKNVIKNQFDISGSVNQFFQGPHRELLVSMLGKFYIGSSSKITGRNKAKKIGIGAMYRLKDAFIPQVVVEFGAWTAGVSYDISVSEFGRYNSKGGIEFSLQYAILDHALFSSSKF